ncbi:MAG: serine O-acetyltransferase [Candidatus Omnitrophica bacterium]|nr:serine O-acetyltransferase [Candidatus Omnitrophota bacterium]
MYNNLKYDFRREWGKNQGRNALRKLFCVFWSSGFQAVLSYRICRWLYLKRIPLLHIFIQRFSELVTGVSIPPTVEIGKGLLIEHFGGIVLNGKTKIGEFSTISHQVTIGNRRPGGGSPVIGDHVYLCVGAKVLGDIQIGNHSVIGANSVLLESVPANSVVAGIPGRIVKMFKDNQEYKEFFYDEN